MEFRAYSPGDYEGCRDAILSHSRQGERLEEFRDFVEAGSSLFVLEHEGQIAGCGGYRLEPPDSARLGWITVRADLLGNGLGRFLVFGLLRKLTQASPVRSVTVECSRAVAPFFEKQGFHRAGEEGGEVRLVKKMEVCGSTAPGRP